MNLSDVSIFLYMSDKIMDIFFLFQNILGHLCFFIDSMLLFLSSIWEPIIKCNIVPRLTSFPHIKLQIRLFLYYAIILEYT
jgi:hypothetical protein